MKDELATFARQLGIRSAGGKDVLAGRITAALSGVPFAEPAARERIGQQLAGPLSAETIVPKGQRCTQTVRAWLVQHIGPAFHFDGAMREFFGESDGRHTLGDAVQRWHETRDAGPRAISAQFEYNRFTRAWFAEYPDGIREELLSAWNHYRSVPITQRGLA